MDDPHDRQLQETVDDIKRALGPASDSQASEKLDASSRHLTGDIPASSSSTRAQSTRNDYNYSVRILSYGV